MAVQKFYVLLLTVFSCLAGKGQTAPLRMPAEWEAQKGVFVNYSGDSRDLITTEKVHIVCRDIIRELSAVTKVYVLINESFKPDSLQRLFALSNINTDSVIMLPVYRLFSMGVPRDYGPIIVRAQGGKNKIIRFNWDYVGADFINPDTAWVRRREFIRDRYFNQMGKLLQLEVQSFPLTIEGGEIELNGKGTAILVDSFNLQRNPFLSNRQQDSLLFASLGVTKTIRLAEGVAEDPGVGRHSRISGNIYGNGVGGHIDEFARFVDSKTIFLAMPSLKEAQSDPVKKISYDRMQTNEKILRRSTDQDGNPFTIVHIPVPDVLPETHVVDTNQVAFPVAALINDFPEWKHGDSILFMPAVSYLNFLIVNQTVLIPKYWRPGFSESCRLKDEQVRKIFSEYFPGKKIIQIDSWGMNIVGGGIHCWTQQIPAD